MAWRGTYIAKQGSVHDTGSPQCLMGFEQCMPQSSGSCFPAPIKPDVYVPLQAVAHEALASARLCWQVAWLYTISTSTFMGFLVGASQIILGTPGDLPETVKNIHEKGFVPPEQAPSMFIVSAFSITAGDARTDA